MHHKNRRNENWRNDVKTDKETRDGYEAKAKRFYLVYELSGNDDLVLFRPMLCSLKPQWRWFTEVITTRDTNDLFACDNASIIIFSTYGRNFQDGQTKRRHWKDIFSFLSEKHFRCYHSRTELTSISSHGMLGLSVQQNLNSRSPFLTFSRCQKLPFYLIKFSFACSLIPLET